MIDKSQSYIELGIDTSNNAYTQIKTAYEYVKNQYNDLLFINWDFKRIYTEEELRNARLFKMSVRKYFEPCGRDCGTVYDTSHVCEICKSGERQVSPLYTRKGSYLNNRDVASTISYEIVVSKRFVEFVKDHSLRGLTFGPVYIGKRLSSDIFQLMAQGCELDFSQIPLLTHCVCTALKKASITSSAQYSILPSCKPCSKETVLISLNISIL